MKPLFRSSLSLIFPILLCSSCEQEIIQPVQQEAEPTIERLIFGRYSSRCSTDHCASYFLLSEGRLYADTDDGKRKPFPLQGKWEPLSNSEYALAAQLLTSLPDVIWRSEHDTYGAPDAYDQGGYYLEVLRSDGVHRSWRLDVEYTEMPEFLWPYTRKLAEVLSLLS